MLMAMLLVASRLVNAEPVNCEPWSVLKISGLPDVNGKQRDIEQVRRVGQMATGQASETM
jgi:hypothetical protein